MNRRDVGEGFYAPRRMSDYFKDRDEELSFFRDLKKREKVHVASLLQPVSEEFEPNNGNHGLYRMDSEGKRGTGLEFLAESGKNDYNWLKTPPATPLFPSLEMEANGQEIVIQREIPIMHPLSRFAGSSEGNRKTSSTCPNPNPRLPQRHKTPTGRPTTPSLIDKRNMKTGPTMDPKTNQTSTDKTKQNLPAQKNLSRGTKTEPNSNTKPTSRGVSPFARPKLLGFSDETPPNLKTTSRPTSRGHSRPTDQTLLTPQKQETKTPKIRQQSCPRGRKLDANGSSGGSRPQQGQVVGSRMVERFMDARNSNAEDNRARSNMNGSTLKESSKVLSSGNKIIKLNGSLNENSGFGRLMSKSSLDMAIKHMKFQRDSSNSGRKS